MRSAYLALLLVAGCTTPETLFGADPSGGVIGTGGSGPATSSTTGAGGSGGAATVGPGGNGGVSSTSSAGGSGVGGSGGALGTGGQGGTGGDCTVDHDAICAALPGGVCGDVDDGCGGVTACGNEACVGGGLACWPSEGICLCQSAAPEQQAVNICAGLGLSLPHFCGEEPTDDTPPECVPTDAHISLDRIWCCGT